MNSGAPKRPRYVLYLEKLLLLSRENVRVITLGHLDYEPRYNDPGSLKSGEFQVKRVGAAGRKE